MLIDRFKEKEAEKSGEGSDPLLSGRKISRAAFFRKMGLGNDGGAGRSRFRRGAHRRGNSFLGRGFSQRVVVKIHYKKHGAPGVSKGAGGAGNLRGHLSYITRSGAGIDEEKPELFGSVGVDSEISAADFYALCEDDRHHFRFIISPENAHLIEDMEGYIRDVMGRVSEDLDTDLQWVSAIHYDTDNPHAHVIVRGVDDQGQDLVIAPDQISNGIRERAQEVATELLGERSMEEIQEAMRQDVGQMRVTSFDRYIAEAGEKIDGGDIKFDTSANLKEEKGTFFDEMVRERLKFLSSTALAHEIDPGVYQLHGNFQAELREISERNDIIKHMYRVMPDEDVTPYRVIEGEGDIISGRVEKVGLSDELHDRKYMVIRDGNEDLHYVSLSQNAYSDRIREGAIVEVSPPKKSKGKADQLIHESAAENNGIYDPKVHLAQIVETQKGLSPDDKDYMKDPERFVGFHETRAKTLVKAGIAEDLGDGRYAMPNDVIAQGKALNEEMEKKRKKRIHAHVKILSERSIEDQVSVEARTFLDLEIYRHQREFPLSYPNADQKTEKALQERQAWLEARGFGYYDTEGSGQFIMHGHALKTLYEREIERQGEHLARQFGRNFQIKEFSEQASHVKYIGHVPLHSGQHIMVENEDRSFSFIKSNKGVDDWNRWEPITVKMQDNKAVIERESLDISKEKAGEKLSELYDLPYQDVQLSHAVRGTYVDSVWLSSGHYAVVKGKDMMTLMKLSHEVDEIERGSEVTIHPAFKGQVKLVDNSRQLELDLGRGRGEENELEI